MYLALVLGSNGDNIKSKLNSVKDNLTIETFRDVNSFINNSIKRELNFDRVIILSTLVTSDNYIESLYNFWDDFGRYSEIVLLCRKDVDDDLARKFLSRFCSISVTSMSVSSITLRILGESVVSSIQKLTELYGIEDYLAVEVEQDVYEIPKVEEPKEEIKQEQVQKPKERVSLLSRLFGGRKQNQKQEKVENFDSTGSISDTNDSDEESTDFYESDNSYVSDVYESQQYEESYETSDEQTSDDSYSGSYETEYYEEADNFYEESSTESSLEEENDEQNDFNFGTVDIIADDFSDDGVSLDIVDEDFGDLTYASEEVEDSSFSQTSEYTAEEVEDLDEDFSVGSAEEEYRKNTEAPKVIEREVVREVIKSVKASSVVENIFKGVSHKLLIITGDRGSGVTMTALTIAKYFAERCHILYFDCDTENNGVLNYIDYFNFKNYEQSHMQGVKLCRSSNVFNSCVCKWDTNFDLLTTDFGTGTTEEELVLAQGIVAENLSDYGLVIVDCPLSKLHCVQDLILTGNVCLCIEDTKRGYMNTFLALDKSELPLRYKRSIISKGTLLRTKVNPNTDYKRLLKYINNVVDLEDCNWLEMVTDKFDGKVTPELLAEILEG